MRPLTLGVLLVLACRGSAADEIVIRSGDFAARLTTDGELVGIALPRPRPGGDRRGEGAEEREIGVRAFTQLPGLERRGPVSWRKVGDSRAEFRRPVSDGSGRTCVLVDSFTVVEWGLRWEAVISGQGETFSVPIETHLQWPTPDAARFWTAWGDPLGRNQAAWQDPLQPQPLRDLDLVYGGDSFAAGHAFSLPIATVIDPKRDLGLSLIQTPDDTVLDMHLRTTTVGDVIFSRLNRRISRGCAVRYTVTLVTHAGDWRGALACLSERCHDYVEPPLRSAGEVSGLGAYSIYEGPLDAEKLHRMGFGVNWKASYDFPYMGMFLPPVDRYTEWPRFGGGKTSVAQMADYSRRMREQGFRVLNYFNCTEFGAGLTWPPPERKAKSDADLWRDANDFTYGKLRDAVLRGPDGSPLWTWGNAVAMDPGDPTYAAFLLDQADRHIDDLPDSSGICIDRMDWLTQYSCRADDGISWVDGPARSLLVSWRSLMERLGPMMHKAGKVVFVNALDHRLDMMRQVDGIYDEMATIGPSINQCALLCLDKPMLGWIGSANDMRPDPDAFLQRYLYLGVFPTAPFPQNDHTINPDAWAERCFMDYGPLFDALRGRRWTLIPHVAEVTGGRALVNAFDVPGGYLFPIVHGPADGTVELTVRGVDGNAEVIRPGESEWSAASARRDGAALRVTVPLARGCALVRLSYLRVTPEQACFTSPIAVTMSTPIEGARICYTLDGSEPTACSPVYRGPIRLTPTTAVKAMLCGAGVSPATLVREYVRIKPSPPTIVPASQVFADNLTVSIELPYVEAGHIHYTLDGGEPTGASRLYVGPFAVTGPATVKARRYLPGGGSDVAEARYRKAPPPPDVFLSDRVPMRATVGWGDRPRKDLSIQDHPLAIAGKTYARGLGVHAVSEVVYALRPEYGRFVAVVGVDDEMHDYTAASITFRVLADDALLGESPVLRLGDAWAFDEPIPPGAKLLRLVVTDAGDGINCDHADWAEAGFRPY